MGMQIENPATWGELVKTGAQAGVEIGVGTVISLAIPAAAIGVIVGGIYGIPALVSRFRKEPQAAPKEAVKPTQN